MATLVPWTCANCKTDHESNVHGSGPTPTEFVCTNCGVDNGARLRAEQARADRPTPIADALDAKLEPIYERLHACLRELRDAVQPTEEEEADARVSLEECMRDDCSFAGEDEWSLLDEVVWARRDKEEYPEERWRLDRALGLW